MVESEMKEKMRKDVEEEKEEKDGNSKMGIGKHDEKEWIEGKKRK